MVINKTMTGLSNPNIQFSQSKKDTIEYLALWNEFELHLYKKQLIHFALTC